LRRLLGDDTHEPRFIATVPTVGYRFLCDVEIAQDGVIGSVGDPHRPPAVETNVPPKAQEQPAVGRRKKTTTLLLAGLCALAISIPTAIFLLRHAVSKHEAPGHVATEQRVTSNSPEAPVKFAAVSPDGKYVAYADPTGLYLRVIASGEIRRWDLPKDFVAARSSSWFPDGTHLLVTRLEGPTRTPSLWKLSLLGASPRKLIDNAGPGSVSPDGTRIAFVTHPPSPGCLEGRELWVMGVDGSNPHKIAEVAQPTQPGSAGSWIFPPAWSPDGRRIACIELPRPILPNPFLPSGRATQMAGTCRRS